MNALTHPLERPAREPFSVEGHPFRPSLEQSFGQERILWIPTQTEPGQERFTVTTHTFNDRESTADFMPLERVAKFGMRPVYEAIGLYSSYTVREDTETCAMPVTVREAALAFHGSARFAQSFNALTAGMPPDTRFTIEVCAPGKFQGTTWIPSIARKKLLIPDGGGNPYRKVPGEIFNHDLRVHIPAWLSMPPIVTTGIYQKTISLTKAYLVAREDMKKDPDTRKDLDADFRALERAKKEISDLTGNLEVVNTINLDRLIHRRHTEEMLTPFLAKLLGGEREMYQEAILEHMANPRPENLLVAVA